MPSLLPQLREVGHAPLRGAADAGGGPAGSGAVRQQDEGQVSASLRGLPPEPSVRQHGASQPLQAGPQEAGRGLPRDLTQEAGRGLPGTSPRLAAWCPVSRLLWAGAEGLRNLPLHPPGPNLGSSFTSPKPQLCRMSCSASIESHSPQWRLLQRGHPESGRPPLTSLQGDYLSPICHSAFLPEPVQIVFTSLKPPTQL